MKISIVTTEPIHPCSAGNRARILSVVEHCISLGHEIRILLITNDEEGSRETSKNFDGLTDVLKHIDHDEVAQPKGLFNSLNSVLIKSKVILGRILPDSLKIWKKFNKPPSSREDIDYNMPASLAKKAADTIIRNSPDIIILNYVSNSLILEYLPDNIHTIIDTHDVFTERFELFKEIGMKPEFYSFTREAEKKGLMRADRIIAITREDKDFFDKMGTPKCNVVGYIGEMKSYLPRKDPERPVFGLLASSNLFNKAALDWLFSLVLRQQELLKVDFKLIIGGKIEELYIGKKMDPRVVFLGKVDYDEFYRSTDVILNPMQVGTGLKFKSCEALACGKPLICTTTGATGLTDGVNQAFLVSDDPAEYARHMMKCATNPSYRDSLAKEAARFMGNYMDQQKEALSMLLSMEDGM